MLQSGKVLICAGLGLAICAGAALAEPMTGKQATKQLFSAKKSEVQLLNVNGLSAEHSALLGEVVKGYAYYAAAAIAPQEDLLKSEATTLVANHHSAEAASAAALAGCNALRKTADECVIAAIVQPKGWEARALQLSVEGTVALKSDYGKRGERAMAASASTGFFALAKGVQAQALALRACADKGAPDCEIIVADPK
ncbi:5-aminolevulic acid synthase (plasmid) [Pseudorhodobacter turbinis]|uniref:5-aminolevulic acid synthase n=1 Tax=Pseudorhodobacter turbinis TaxID=2500533 RepID=A0A4P8EL24_9RHOB|nr:5-aminolevulic acid synthase [Pseudorhodobacter turbinis]QCO57971.1 5-aminolevulic acid synthase [Pseudorhodobacter turbinis]